MTFSSSPIPGPSVDRPSQDQTAEQTAVRPARRGPTWAGVAAMVAAGSVLSSGATLGGLIGYHEIEQRWGSDVVAASTRDAGSAGTASGVAASSDGTDWQQVAAAVSPSAVAIDVRTAQGEAEGTGVVLDEKGDIVTNNHVVSGASSITVTLADGRAFEARVVGVDARTDLAVVRLVSAPDDLVPATFGDSAAVEPGAAVMALGTPLGLQNTVTTGIVSAVDRPVTASDGSDPAGTDATYVSAVQTDAAINPGNSGGPLVDASGAVIGINSSIASLASGADGQSGSIGLGFAIPSATVTMVVQQILQHGAVQHAALGVTAADGTQEADSATRSGALVHEVVRGSAAEAAGLRPGDLVIGVDDVPITGAAALTATINGLASGTEHTVAVLREGKRTELTATLGIAATS